jgi:hypothetical protein
MNDERKSMNAFGGRGMYPSSFFFEWVVFAVDSSTKGGGCSHMNVLGAVASGASSKRLWSVLYVMGVMFAANVNVMDGYGFSTSGGMSGRRGAMI